LKVLAKLYILCLGFGLFGSAVGVGGGEDGGFVVAVDTKLKNMTEVWVVALVTQHVGWIGENSSG
jgi:hypothetical protein